MDELLQVPPQSAAEYEAAIDRLLSEISRLNHQMEGDRAEINRLKAETQELRAATRAILARIGSRI